ncbi:hypothetical protein F5887DRAFT_976195 [Amanita rubescens]|nr:hypothetical protein F5887DRAFT_976195 [Amanita rubescens]
MSPTELTGIPPAPRGVPQIEVRFEADANDTILKGCVSDKGTSVQLLHRLYLQR